MKTKLPALLILLIGLGSSNLTAQDFDTDYDIHPEYSLTLKISPQHFLWGGLPLTGEYGLHLERRITARTAIEGSLAYLGKGLLLLSAEAEETYSGNTPVLGITGFRAQGSYRFYINTREKNTGLFIAPHLSFASAKYYEKYSSASSPDDGFVQGMHTDYSGIMGMRWVMGRLSLETFAGAGYRSKHWLTKDYTGVNILSREDITDIYIINEPLVIKLGFRIGIQL